MKHIITTALISFAFFSQSQNISIEDAQSDYTQLVQTISSVHYDAFRNISQEDYQKMQQELYASWEGDSISVKEFTRCGMKLTSILGMGHTSFDWQHPGLMPALSTYSFIPFKARLTNNHLIVTSSKTDEIHVGDTINQINGQSGSAVFQEIMSYTGGVDAFKTTVSEMLFPLYLFFNPEIEGDHVVKLSSNKLVHIENTLTINEAFEFLGSDLSKPDYTFELLEQNIGLLSYNSCNDYEAFQLFLDTTFTQIREQNIEHLIIDIRYNGGGNSSLNNLLLSYLTRKAYRQSSGRFWKVSAEVQDRIRKDSLWYEFFDPSFLERYLAEEDQSVIDDRDLSMTKNEKPQHYFKGKHCFLIGPYTFSSANFLADAVKTFGLSTLIGQNTGELTNDFGEQVEFQLPKSGSYFYSSTTFDIGADNKIESIKTVQPDIKVMQDPFPAAIEWLLK